MEEVVRRDILHIFLLIVFWFIYLRISSWFQRKKFNLPPGPKGYPIFGCLPMLGDEPHFTLLKWAKQYGDVYGLYLGKKYVVVLSDPVKAKELFNQASNSDRPPNFFNFLPDGTGLADINGLEWSEQRRYTMREMKNLGLGRSEWDDLLQDEVQHFLEFLEKSNGQPLDYSEQLSASFSNNILSLVTGKQLSPGDPRRDILLKGTESFEIVNVQTGLPSIFPNLYKKVVDIGLVNLSPHRENLMNLNKFVKKEIQATRNARNERETYITGYLKEMDDGKKNSNSSFNEKNLVGNVQALILAGTDTTHMSVSWLLLAMATHPDVQDKVHEELDAVLGHSDEPVSFATDRNRLPYCFATIQEGQRWKTVAPLNLYHRCTTDIKIGDYDVPAGSDLMAFIWAFHNNPKYWPEPEQFKPERFLDETGILKKKAFAPFSLGKRKCPGELVAYMEIFVYFISIMRKFRILLPKQDEKFDLNGILALTFRPKPHKLQFVSRENNSSRK